MTDTLTIYHDGSCPLCQIEIANYRRRDVDRRLRFVDVSAADCDPGPGLDRELAMSRFHVREPDGYLRSGAEGFVAVWRRLPAWRGPARLADLPGALTLLEAGYRLSQPLRPRLARFIRAVRGT